MSITAAFYNAAEAEMTFEVQFEQNCWDDQLTLQFIPDENVDPRYYASVQVEASI